MVRMIIAGMARVRRVSQWGKRREQYESICSKEEQLAAYGVTWDERHNDALACELALQMVRAGYARTLRSELHAPRQAQPPVDAGRVAEVALT